MKLKASTHALAVPNVLHSEPTPFSAEQCDALFAAVLVHDDIDLGAELPPTIHLDYSQEQLTQCYRICRQLWDEGLDRVAFGKLIEKIRRSRELGDEDRRVFKYARAKFKHLRFAYIVCDRRHQCPTTFDWMIKAMGCLQDAFKYGQQRSKACWSIMLRLSMRKLPFSLMHRQMNNFEPTTTASFVDYVHRQIAVIRRNLAKDGLTGKEFHDTRKIISQQVALYDNLKVLYPSPYHASVSKYLSTINGLMGAVHDELVVRRFNKTQDYFADKFAMPDDIRLRLTALTEKYA